MPRQRKGPFLCRGRNSCTGFAQFPRFSRFVNVKNLAKGIDVFLDIDWQGAQQIRQKVPSVKSIFILPPSLPELERRLVGRGQDSKEVIAERMSKAISEISHYDEYDYVIVNDNFEQALADFQSILQAERLTKAYQQTENADLIHQLLAK